MISHENPNIRWFYLPKEGKMAVEDDASRVSNMERGKPSFQFWLNARAPPRAFLFALAAQMPSTVRTSAAAAPTLDWLPFSKPMRQARTMSLRTKLEIPLQESFKFAPFNLVFQHPLTPICQSWPSRANRFDLFFQGLA